MGKIFCRAYQFLIKIGLCFIPWKTPETIEGAGSIKKLPGVIKKNGYTKILIVTGRNIHNKYHMLDDLLEALDNESIGYAIFDGLQPNPTDINVADGVAVYKKNCCQALIAFGGGSPMDCCKAIGAVCATNKPIEKLQGLFKVTKRVPMIFAVPTTAGTGSETTIAAVITDSKTHHKASISDIRLMPKYAVLDPQLTVALPPDVTSTTGMDALCHAVESYTNNTYTTRLERKLSEDAVHLIFQNIYKSYRDGNELDARQNMQNAAFYAGRSFTRGSVGYVHAIGHTLGGLYGTPHGLAMGVILPHVMRQFGSAVHERLARLAEICGLSGRNDAEKAGAFISWIEEINAKMNIPAHLDVIRDEDIPQMIAWAMKEANPLYPVPVIWREADFEKCIRNIRG